MRTAQQTRTPHARSATVGQVYERILSGTTVGRRVFDVDGRSVHVLESGTGPSLVLLHGTTAAAAMFLPLLGELHGLHASAPDRPGHGLSDRIDLPRRDFRERAVAWIDSLLDRLQLPTTALLGHSGGGVWALWYALAHPDRISRLVLLGPPTLPGTRCPFPLRLVATPGIGELLSKVAPPTPKSVIQFAGAMHERETLASHPDLVDLFVASGRDPRCDRTGRQEVRVFASPAAVLTPSGFRRAARVHPEELRQVSAPTLVMWGSDEPLGDTAVARAAAGLIPRGRLEVLPGGHAPWLGGPSRVAAAVAHFVLGDAPAGAAVDRRESTAGAVVAGTVGESHRRPAAR